MSSGIRLTSEDIIVFETDNGGFTRATLSALGIHPDKPWIIRKNLIGRFISWETYHKAVDGVADTARVKKLLRDHEQQPLLFQ